VSSTFKKANKKEEKHYALKKKKTVETKANDSKCPSQSEWSREYGRGPSTKERYSMINKVNFGKKTQKRRPELGEI